MTSKNTWKGMERKIAKLVGGIRNPLSGRNGKHTSADVIHPFFFVECKYKKKWAVKTLYDKTVKINKKEAKKKNEKEKIPIVVIKEKHEDGELILMSIENFLKIVEKPYIIDVFNDNNINYNKFDKMIESPHF